jgi:hypothetical protein
LDKYFVIKSVALAVAFFSQIGVLYIPGTLEIGEDPLDQQTMKENVQRKNQRCLKYVKVQ